MALYMAIFMGGTPVGAPIIGWVGEVFGARWTIAVGGIVTLLAAEAVTVVQTRRLRLRLGYAASPTPHIVVRHREEWV